MRTIISTASLLVLALGATGCTEYFTVDEACHPKGRFPNRNDAGEDTTRAVNRMNCHRRLVGFEMVGVEPELLAASDGMVSFIQQNPEVYGRGANSVGYLYQDASLPGFSGANVYERLDLAGYTLPDNDIQFHEVVGVEWGDVEPDEVIDSFMQRHSLQELVLKPSPYAVAYSQLELDESWWLSTGLDESIYGPFPEVGTALYAVIVSQGVPAEGAGEEPVTYPKRDQTGVPLTGPIVFDRFQPDLNVDGEVNVLDATQLSFPVSVGYTSPFADTNGGASSDETAFGLEITAATIHGGGRPLDTIWVSPGDMNPANHRLEVTGATSWWAGAAYATEPFEPNTEYTLYVDYTSVDGAGSHSVSFTTGADGAGEAARSMHPSGSLPLLDPYQSLVTVR